MIKVAFVFAEAIVFAIVIVCLLITEQRTYKKDRCKVNVNRSEREKGMAMLTNRLQLVKE